MRARSFSRYDNRELLCLFRSLLTRDRVNCAALLACMAEVDARKIYLPAGYPSMYAFCVHEYEMSEDSACKRIRAARAARECPAILAAVADERLNLTGVVMLAPYLTPENAQELLAAAEHKTNAQIEELLAQRFPRAELAIRLEALVPTVATNSSTGQSVLSAARRIEVRAPRLVPVAQDSFSLQLVLPRSSRDRLRYAEEMLGHEVRLEDLVQVFDLGIEALIEKLEQRRFAGTRKPRPAPRNQPPSTNPRYIPSHVKRTVWERDGGRCTFVSQTGRRCAARSRLEFDHVMEVARGGRATVEGIRLRCRGHNQYGAECTFGAEFMRRKREEAREIRRKEAAVRLADQARQRERAAKARAAAEEVITPLRLLGFRADEAQRAAAMCESMHDAPLEERVRRALSHLSPRVTTIAPARAHPAAM